MLMLVVVLVLIQEAAGMLAPAHLTWQRSLSLPLTTLSQILALSSHVFAFTTLGTARAPASLAHNLSESQELLCAMAVRTTVRESASALKC